jgi:hypothetical protein
VSDPVVAQINAMMDMAMADNGLNNAYLANRHNTITNGTYRWNQQNLNAQAYDASRIAAEQNFRQVDLGRQREGDRMFLAGRQFDSNAAQNASNADLAWRQYLDTVTTNRDRGALTDRTLGNSLGANQLGADRRRWETMTDATARGAVGSQDYGMQRGFTNRDLGLANDRDRITADTARVGIDASDRANRLSYDQRMSDIDKMNRDNRIDFDRSARNYEDQGRIFDSLSREYGISREAAQNALYRGLDRLGIDYQDALDAVQNSIRGNNRQTQATLDQLMFEAMNAGVSGGR